MRSNSPWGSKSGLASPSEVRSSAEWVAEHHGKEQQVAPLYNLNPLWASLPMRDAWNIFDMLAYIMVFVGIAQIYQFLEEDQYVGQYFQESVHCSGLCETVGFEDDLP